MVSYAYLSPHNNTLTNIATARNSSLSCYYCIIAYYNIVCNLENIFFFNVFFNNGAPQCSPVYAYICPYLHIILYYYIPNLRNLLINTIIIFHKPKTIASYYSSAVYYNIFSNNHIVIYTYI